MSKAYPVKSFMVFDFIKDQPQEFYKLVCKYYPAARRIIYVHNPDEFDMLGLFHNMPKDKGPVFIIVQNDDKSIYIPYSEEYITVEEFDLLIQMNML